MKQLILAKGTFPQGMELWAYSPQGRHAMLPLERSALADLGVPWVLKVGRQGMHWSVAAQEVIMRAPACAGCCGWSLLACCRPAQGAACDVAYFSLRAYARR